MNSKVFLVIGMVMSLVVASMLNVYPLGYTLASIRPMFMAMVLIFWVMYRSTMLGVWPVFLVGLICDLLLSTHLGHQAFSMVLAAFVLRVLLLRARELSLVQAWALASVGLCVFQVSLWILQAFVYTKFIWLGFGSLVSSIVLFPLIWQPLYWINSHLKERAF